MVFSVVIVKINFLFAIAVISFLNNSYQDEAILGRNNSFFRIIGTQRVRLPQNLTHFITYFTNIIPCVERQKSHFWGGGGVAGISLVDFRLTFPYISTYYRRWCSVDTRGSSTSFPKIQIKSAILRELPSPWHNDSLGRFRKIYFLFFCSYFWYKFSHL